MKISDFLSEREFRETGIYRELARPFGVSDQLGIIVPVPGHIIGVAVNRDTSFTADECAMMELIQPHYARAFKNAQLFSSLRGQDAVLDYTAWRRHGLSRRECDVLRWMVEGKRNSEIAIILSISPLTVKTHVERILARLGAETRTVAAVVARRIFADQ